MRLAICKQFVSNLKSSALSVYSNIVPLHVLKVMKTMATRYFAQTAPQNSFKGVISLDFYYHVFFFLFTTGSPHGIQCQTLSPGSADLLRGDW